ncbi:MAG: polysaccharide biosynthesis protein [Clostridia bacterium]|nr:polysaccharide biosynthesis protein [Clostridia bacterium]MBQ7289206.1 polysaccharide biosynthesis protein [Clostridia bacterium]
MENKRRQHTFLQGAAILVFATALVKVLGAIFRIPLANLIGETGMGYYSTAYDLYLPIYSLSMAGFPIAISRIVAEFAAQKRFKDVRKTLQVAKRAFWVTGLLGFALMLLCAYPFALYTGDIKDIYSIFAIAPSLLFCCMLSSYMGYYEGMRNMNPTALASVLQATARLVFGYGFAIITIKICGNLTTSTAAFAAAAALAGVSMSCFTGFFFLFIRHKKVGDGITAEELAESPEPMAGKELFKKLLFISVPIVIGSLVTQVANLVDVLMVRMQLKTLVTNHTSYIYSVFSDLIASRDLKTNEIPTALYGCYKGLAYSVYNLVPSITSVMGVSAIPVLATAWTQKDKTALRTNLETIIKTASLIAMPAGFGMLFLANGILNVLYPQNPYGVIIATPSLQILGLTAIFAGITGPLTNILQGIGKQTVPVKNMAIGVILKIVLNYILVGIPDINITGAAIGTIACYSYICIANYICVLRYTKVKVRLFTVAVKPMICALLCGLSALSVSILLKNSGISLRLSTLTSIVVAVIVYAILIILTRTIDKNDIISLPKGKKLLKVLEKLRVIR